MRIAIDVSPLSSGHKVRGVGFYLKHLLLALKKYHSEYEIVEFTGRAPSGVDLIHYPYFDPFFLTLPFFQTIPTVVTVHDLTPLVLPELFPVGLKGMLKWQLQKLALQKVRGIITDSVSSQKDIGRITGITLHHIDPVYLAAGEEFRVIKEKEILKNVQKKYNLPESFIFYVGDATPNKNVPRIVKAALFAHMPIILAGKVFRDETVDLSSPWTKDIAYVRGLEKENPDRVRLLGFVPDEDLVALYNLSTVFLMPSLYEGFGLPILEAMSCGVPVITSERGSLKEVAGDAALFVDPENIDDISQAVQKMLSEHNRKIYKEKGIARAKAFSWKKTANKTAALYEKARK